MLPERGITNPPRPFWQFYAAPVAIMVLAYLLPMGYCAVGVSQREAWALKARQELKTTLERRGPIALIMRELKAGHPVRATLLVFLWNFTVGAVAMSTLVGGALFVGPVVVAIGRGGMLGLMYDPAMFQGTHGLVAVGTGVLELPVYMIAGALGIRLGLAWVLPPRRARLQEVWEHARWTIPAAAVQLLVAAAWEVGGIVLVGGHP